MDLGDIDIECPDCNAAVKVKLADVAQQRTVRCPNGHQIRLTDQGGGVRRAQKATDDLERQLRDLGFK